MRGKIQLRDMAVDTLLTAQRALFQVGKPIRYHLEYPNGGTDPDADGPQDKETGQADCIALALYAAGLDRLQSHFPLYDGYINTDSMIDEAKGPGKWFSRIASPIIGSFIVGHTYRKKTPPFRSVCGHIGVIVDVSEYEKRGLAGLGVVHCSPYNYQFTGGKSAIWKTSAQIWGGYPDLCFIEFNRSYALSLAK